MKVKLAIPWSVLCSILVILAVTLLMACTPKPSSSDEYVLEWASFQNASHLETMALQKNFFDQVNAKSKGELTIKFRGGPEVIAPPDLGGAVQKGIVDIGMAPCGFYEAIAPGVGAAVLSNVTVQKERTGGAFDYFVEIHNKGGLTYLGRPFFAPKGFFYVYLNKKVATPRDLAGLKIGGTTAGRAPAIGWGANFVSLQMDEYFTSMESGLVDGVNSSPLVTWVSSGSHEVTKYIIDHPFYQSSLMTFMNLNSWNKLPKHLQKLMLDIMAEAEDKGADEFEKINNESMQKVTAAGVEKITFSSQDAKWFIDTAFNAGWAYQQERFPDVTPKLKELLSK